MTRDFQAIPAISSLSERVFNYASNLITKKRTRIDSENKRYVLCLRRWGLLSESDDEEDMIFNENRVRIETETPATIVIPE